MISQRLTEEINDLKSHPHISNIQITNDFTIQMTYSPSDTSSVYKDKVYRILLNVPQTYPDDPPALQFLDPIYHLNINYESGEVRMAILEEDWSPFLSLTSVIESLDHIIQQPEEGCPYASQILHQYENDRQHYFQKVLGSVDYSIQAQLCASGQNVIDLGAEAQANENYSGGRDFQPANKSSILVQQLRESMMEIELGGHNTTQKKAEKQKRIPQLNLKESVIIDEKLKNKKVSKSIQKQQKNPIHANQDLKSPRNHTNNRHKNTALNNINETINIFIQEIEQIEQQMGKAKTPAIKAILKARQDSQFQMMKQVVQMSENLKKGLVRKIRQEINKI